MTVSSLKRTQTAAVDCKPEGFADIVAEIHMNLSELKNTVENLERNVGMPVVRPRERHTY
jgi:hypothetical protein